MTRAVKDFGPVTPGASRLTRQRGAPGTYSPSGVWGDPTLASREKGRTLVEGLVRAILADIETVRSAPLPVPGAPVEAPAAPPRPAPATTRGGCTLGDERTIRAIGEAYAAHWTNLDALKFAALWSEEGDIVHPDGNVERGMRTILSNRFELFSRKDYKGSRHLLTVLNVRCLTSDIGVADGKWELRGVTDPGGKVLPNFEGLCTVVVKRTGSSWLIEAYRYTVKPSATPLPTWLKQPGWPIIK